MSAVIDLTESQSQADELDFLLGAENEPIIDHEEHYHDRGCSRLPSECMCAGVSWIWATHKDRSTKVTPRRSGKWMLFLDSETVDGAWLTIIDLLAQRKLGGCAKVIPKRSKDHMHVVCVYTNDHENVKDVFSVLHTLRTSGIALARDCTLNYKTDDATLAAVYANNTAAERAGFASASALPNKRAQISKYTSMGFRGNKNVVLTLNNIGDEYLRKIIAEVPVTATQREIDAFFAHLPPTATELAEGILNGAGRSATVSDFYSAEDTGSSSGSSKKQKL